MPINFNISLVGYHCTSGPLAILRLPTSTQNAGITYVTRFESGIRIAAAGDGTARWEGIHCPAGAPGSVEPLRSSIIEHSTNGVARITRKDAGTSPQIYVFGDPTTHCWSCWTSPSAPMFSAARPRISRRWQAAPESKPVRILCQFGGKAARRRDRQVVHGALSRNVSKPNWDSAPYLRSSPAKPILFG